MLRSLARGALFSKSLAKVSSNLSVARSLGVRQKNGIMQRALVLRPFSTSPNSNEPSKTGEAPSGTEGQANKGDLRKIDFDDFDDYEPKTAKEKVRYYTTVAMWIGFLAAGAFCIYLTAKELFPGRLGAQSLFSEVFDYLRDKHEVSAMTGEDMRAFGRDVGRNTEGRRNHVDSYSYKADDNSNRTRIRFNIKGNKGQVMVWAEVSDSMASNEYVYIIVQDLKTGRVKTMVDNRDQLEAHMIANPNSNDSFISSLFSKK